MKVDVAPQLGPERRTEVAPALGGAGAVALHVLPRFPRGNPVPPLAQTPSAQERLVVLREQKRDRDTMRGCVGGTEHAAGIAAETGGGHPRRRYTPRHARLLGAIHAGEAETKSGEGSVVDRLNIATAIASAHIFETPHWKKTRRRRRRERRRHTNGGVSGGGGGASVA